MNLVPRTLLARTVILIGVLLVLSLASWLALFALSEREPRARQIATRVSAVVNLTQSALLAAQPEKRLALLEELSQKEGVRIFPMEPEEAALPLPESPMLRLIAREIQKRLGPDTLIVGDESDEEALWVSFSLGPDDYWLVLPHTRIKRGLPWQWLGWAGLTLLLAFAGGWALVKKINRPLRHAAQAASKIGCGHFDEKLDESGPEEISALAKAFNIMGGNLSVMERNRALMLAGISHDLRTPLSRLRLSVEMSVSDTSEQTAMIRDLDDMEMLTRQFLDFAKTDSQEKPTLTDLDAMTRKIAEEYAQRGHNIGITGSAGSANIRPHAMKRALVNLLENALNYASGPAQLLLSNKNGNISLTVIDSGKGLPDSELEAVKDPFYRGEAARTGAKGSGLGLAIVSRIAELHGGSLLLRNRPEGGLAATIKLPAQ